MDSILLVHAVDGLSANDLQAFFVGWPKAPSPEERLEIVRAADEVVVARLGELVVGIATAITDHRFAAYVPLVEVLPDYQGRGIGSQMLRALLNQLKMCYMVDLVCDDDVVPFYERLGGQRLNAMAWRHDDRL